MEREPSPETLKRALDLIKDIEPTRAMLGALGLYCVDIDKERTQRSRRNQRWAIEQENPRIFRSTD